MTLTALIRSFSIQLADTGYEANLPSFLVEFPDTTKLTFFSWHVVVVYLLIAIILAQIVYHYNRNHLYRYYQAYAGLLLLFILSRNTYSVEYYEKFSHSLIDTFGFLVQVWYLCIYFRFGILFLKLDKHAPSLKRSIFSYTLVTSILATAYYGGILLGLLPESIHEGRLFHFIFLPIHVSLAGLIIYTSIKTPEPHKRYFLWGSFFYMAFALIATFALFNPIVYVWFGIEPIVYFFVAIVVECTLFAIGLGKQLRDSIQEKYRLETLLRETELAMEIKILRGQLNSHFIFNVLNSIKAFIIGKDVEEATDYLGKFSKFMRGILEGSSQETKTLREELKTVVLYADIENMRLSNAITITSDFDNRVNLDTVLIPTMVLQPFVENAIWHGLNKSEQPDKNLWISVVKQQDGVLVTIEDNGLGYSNTQAAESKVFAKSYGLGIVREQLKGFNAGNSQQLHFEISDRQGGGTRVAFTITENTSG